MPTPPIYGLKHVFDSAESCIEFLFENKVLYQPLSCPIHKKQMSKGEKTWRCTKYGCNKKYSFLYKSFFADSNIEPHKLMLVLYLKLIDTPSTVIQTITGHSTKTISSILIKFRNLLADNLQFESEVMIGGPGIVVEIDETLISRKNNPWTDKKGVWVFGGVERTGERRVFAQMVPDRTSKTLLEIIRKYVHPDSTVISDCWSAYKQLNKKLKMNHMTVDHSQTFKDPITGAHTNHIEGTWHAIKQKIPKIDCDPKKVDNYIFEFMWKRQNQNNLWDQLINCLASTSYS
jgi:transposase-like protein